ncbi:Hsp20/alpha crystallin family protein [Halobacillus fulvus]|nr:Hsp20/alpha crystallin family protein [Halobacillus fulvus]
MMDMDRIKEWMKVAQQYQGGDFWNRVFEQQGEEQPFQPFDQSDWTKDEPTSDIPKTDIYLTNTHVVVFIEVPGLKKEDIRLVGSGTELYVTIHVRPPVDPEQVILVQGERSFGEYSRRIELPEFIDASSLRTSLENGVMVLSYNRSQETLRDIVIE